MYFRVTYFFWIVSYCCGWHGKTTEYGRSWRNNKNLIRALKWLIFCSGFNHTCSRFNSLPMQFVFLCTVCICLQWTVDLLVIVAFYIYTHTQTQTHIHTHTHTFIHFTGNRLGAQSEKWRRCCGEYCMMFQKDGSGSSSRKTARAYGFCSHLSPRQAAKISLAYTQVRDLSASAHAFLQFAHCAAPAHYYWWSF